MFKKSQLYCSTYPYKSQDEKEINPSTYPMPRYPWNKLSNASIALE